MFRFKQFTVDQSGCAMKINTDGVLLGAFAEAHNPESILDIGTGTGVIALMLAQRFTLARIDAVEIDQLAAKTAARNFARSPFAGRLSIYPLDFEAFFAQHPAGYDLVVSNPPFYINSLKSPKAGKELAKHAGGSFFEKLIFNVSMRLAHGGLFCLILPIDTAELVTRLAEQAELYPQKIVRIRSFENSEPHRLILYFGFEKTDSSFSEFIIYKSAANYSEHYAKLLKPYFIVF
jgi:tRNA1Val (adenine37-N6)-methyltransferase